MSRYKRSSLISDFQPTCLQRGGVVPASFADQGIDASLGRSESQVIDGLIRAAPIAAALWLGLVGMVTLIF